MTRDAKLNRRKLIFQILGKWWLVLGIAVVTAIVSSAVYYVREFVLRPERFESSFTIYLTFEESGSEVNVQYYNAYTWREIVKDDPIMDSVMEHLPTSYDREEVKRSIRMTMPSDVRVLIGTITTANAENSDEIAKALSDSILQFKNHVDVFSNIELWKFDNAKPVVIDCEIVRVAIVSGVLGLLFALAGVWIFYLSSDRIDTVEDAMNRFDIPVVGIYDRNGRAIFEQEESANRKKLLQDGITAVVGIDVDEKAIPECVLRDDRLNCTYFAADGMDGRRYEELRSKTAVVIAMKAGRANGSRMEHAIAQLSIQDIAPAGLLLLEGNEKLLKRYYHVKKLK